LILLGIINARYNLTLLNQSSEIAEFARRKKPTFQSQEIKSTIHVWYGMLSTKPQYYF